ncbi:MAG: hypothetical protein WCE51_16525, partial [Chthoniobacterales bacterium]
MKKLLFLGWLFCLTNGIAFGQDTARKSESATTKPQGAFLEIRGNRVFTDKELRSHLKEELETIEEYGLTSARADDAAFFLELFYKKHGYARADVSYTVESANRFRLNVFEGPLVHLGKIDFIGNHDVPARKLFKYAVSLT